MGQRKFRISKLVIRWLLASGAALAITGCGGGSSSGNSEPSGAGQNQVPQISGTPPSLVTVGTAYSFQPGASDSDGHALSFQASGLPAWATFSAATGRLSGTPTSADVGMTADIVIGVSDGQASASLAPFAIEVQAAPPPPGNSPPTILGSPPTSTEAGQGYSFQPSASDAEGDNLTFSIVNLPAWATFSASTGRLSGTPTGPHVGMTTDIVIGVSDGQASASLAPFAIEVQAAPPPPGNSPPTILGSPPTSAEAGQGYSFQPSASDAEGDNLTFSIVNLPAWATFSAATGRLSGTPTSADVGTYSPIVITVSDGTDSAALAGFFITVTQISTGSAMIAWLPPTQNTDGSALTDLAGFHIYYGTNATDLSQTVTVASPGLTTYVVQNLTGATWYFSVRAYSTDGTESAPSNLASKTIQ